MMISLRCGPPCLFGEFGLACDLEGWLQVIASMRVEILGSGANYENDGGIADKRNGPAQRGRLFLRFKPDRFYFRRSCRQGFCLLRLRWAELTKGSVKRSLIEWPAKGWVNKAAFAIMSTAFAGAVAARQPGILGRSPRAR